MGLSLGKKSKSKKDKKKKGKMDKDKDHDIYYRAEFDAMDSNKNGVLTTAEFARLLVSLGYSGGADGVNALLLKVNRDHNATITIDEYMRAVKADSAVHKETSRYRDMFRSFDKDRDGSAKKKDVFKGLKKMGIDVDDNMKQKIDGMDVNHDGKLEYREFLRVQLGLTK